MYSLIYLTCFFLTLTPQAPHYPPYLNLAKQTHEKVKQKRQKQQLENNKKVKPKGKLALLHV